MVVVDASAIIEQLLGRPEVLRGHATVHAPAALDLEVVSAWRRMVLRGALPASSAREAIELYSAMSVTRHEHVLLLPRIWQLRHDITAFDAAYVALAEALGVPLLTADLRLARTASRYCDVVTV